jgi:hypothetical protein
MISRRSFLFGTAAAATGAAAGVVLSVNNPFEPLPVAAAAPGDERFTYRGRSVVVSLTPAAAHITVDGTADVHADRVANQFVTHVLPFQSFPAPRKLAQAVIDASADQLVVL